MKIEDLVSGNYYVYTKYGVCQYVKPEIIKNYGVDKQFYTFYFKNKRQCFLIKDQIDKCIFFYADKDKEDVKLSNMDNNKSWKKRKQKTMLEIKKQSEELMKVYKKRSELIGFKFSKDNDLQRKFEGDFPYELSDGQARSLNEIKADMESDKIMDRILVGDVGFGKTEIAMRAAFKAVLSCKQVIIITPSRILSHQHFQDFTDRFEGYNVNIALLDSKRNKKRTETLQKIKEGEIDVIIGTQNVLSDYVQYKNAGLMVIDEEHKMGIVTKDKIKKMKANIDILSMTATPIPRSLNLTNLHLRDISVIDTPPKNKIAPITKSMSWNDERIKFIINRELSRKGGVFIVDNNIIELYQLRDKLLKLIPDLKIAIINGKMKNNEIEDIMSNILDRKYNIVLATSIIEVGITIKFINTIIIYNAQNLGLAQIHQLRGRINRGNNGAEGYCILTYPKGTHMDDTAKKRLKIICENSDLNSGIDIAKEDMKIRGAGELIGLKQSGQMINKIGMDFYMSLMDKQLKELA